MQVNAEFTATRPRSQSLFPTSRCPGQLPQHVAKLGLDPSLSSRHSVTITTTNRRPGF